MADEFSELSFDQDLQEASTAEDAQRWKIEKIAPLCALVTISSQKAPEDFYYARLLWCKYPDEAPSLKFQDKTTGRYDVPQAWPEMRGFRPTSVDACVNWTKEGFALHPEWNGDPNKKWIPKGNMLLKVIRILQSELDEQLVRRFGQQ